MFIIFDEWNSIQPKPRKVVSKLSFLRFFFAFFSWKISLFKYATHLLYVIFGEAFNFVYRFFKLDFYLKLSEKNNLNYTLMNTRHNSKTIHTTDFEI